MDLPCRAHGVGTRVSGALSRDAPSAFPHASSAPSVAASLPPSPEPTSVPLCLDCVVGLLRDPKGSRGVSSSTTYYRVSSRQRDPFRH